MSNVSAVAIPRYEYVMRFRLANIGIVYRCDSCNEPVFLRFKVGLDPGNSRALISEEFEQVERPGEDFDFKYLKGDVLSDFKEALTCYSNGAFNGFAAMCRRTVQSVSADLGAEGKDKVLNQLKDLKDMAQVDEETFALLKQIVIDGHDGAHPHLPKLNADRAAILLELMKGVLYQVYVRKGKIQEAMSLRAEAGKTRKP